MKWCEAIRSPEAESVPGEAALDGSAIPVQGGIPQQNVSGNACIDLPPAVESIGGADRYSEIWGAHVAIVLPEEIDPGETQAGIAFQSAAP